MALDQEWEGWVRARREVGFGDSAQLMGGPRSFGRRAREYPDDLHFCDGVGPELRR